MSQKEAIQLFEQRKVRTIWDSDKEKWYFSIVDIVGVLTESSNPTDYFKKMRKRDAELNTYVGTNCPQVLMTTDSGKRRRTLAADTEQLFRIIQSIPSPKAEPIKQWMAQATTTQISKNENPQGMAESAEVARRGGKTARTAREAAEREIGQSIVSRENAHTLFNKETLKIESEYDYSR